MNGVVMWQRAEGAVVFVASMLVYLNLDAELSWWLALLVFFAPDLSFAAYLLGNRAGAFGYNLVHVYAFGTAVFAVGFVTGGVGLAAVGALWLSHSGFDRMLGYGLKSTEGFKVTHLGRIG
ncbi:DUF4260 domain-containing protein [Aliiroseovarius sp. YM-037]|uniref:DUF4260 domain-containing protein n=1 Tax=Aliiroseovarius sp. YM-037 TaxID=3341728 RepID=UPI003A7FAC76